MAVWSGWEGGRLLYAVLCYGLLILALGQARSCWPCHYAGPQDWARLNIVLRIVELAGCSWKLSCRISRGVRRTSLLMLVQPCKWIAKLPRKEHYSPPNNTLICSLTILRCQTTPPPHAASSDTPPRGPSPTQETSAARAFSPLFIRTAHDLAPGYRVPPCWKRARTGIGGGSCLRRSARAILPNSRSSQPLLSWAHAPQKTKQVVLSQISFA